MVTKTHIWPEQITESNGQITAKATIESHNQICFGLWYRLSSQYRDMLTETADPFVVAMIFFAMQRSSDLFVHGDVSSSLLGNLEEFQSAWSCWLPDKYTRIEFEADNELSEVKGNESDKAVTVFSGGMDSCFTAWRHSRGTSGRSRHNLQAALMVHGFDIDLEDSETFIRAAGKSKKILESLGIKLITIETNFKDLVGDWEDAHAAGLASSLMMLQKDFKIGLIPGGPPYDNISISSPWGSNPITDRLLSSDSFEIIHDGAGFTRAEKICEIADWPEAMQHMRVCWQGDMKDRNCGRCEKCIRTILNFKALGLEVPGCFEQDITDGQIASVNGLGKQHLFEYVRILSTAKKFCKGQSWVAALDKCIRRNQWAINAKRIGFRRHLYRLEHILSKTTGVNK